MIQLSQTSGVFNLGDTSFRRKAVLSDCKVILQSQAELQSEWDIKNSSQIDLYKDLVINKKLIESVTWDKYINLIKSGQDASRCLEDIKKEPEPLRILS